MVKTISSLQNPFIKQLVQLKEKSKLRKQTGIFIIDPEEQGVIKRFGEVTEVVGPGPHYHLPSPIETVQIAPVTAVRRLEIGFRTIQLGPPAKYRRVLKESLMLTGDENIIDV